MTFNSGKESTATIEGTELPTTEWSVDPSVEIVRFLNSKTDDYAIKKPTFKDCTFTITIDWDFDSNPFQTPTTLNIGTELTNVRLYLNGVASEYWHFPTAIVVGTPQSTSTEGKIVTTINCENSGEFGIPGSPVA